MERETEPKVAAGLQEEGWPGGGAKLKETALQESHGQGVAVRSNAGAYGKSGPQSVCMWAGCGEKEQLQLERAAGKVGFWGTESFS